MTTIIKAANAAQFLALVPHLVGFTPTRSLALIPFAGSRTLGAMRFDLPESSDPDEIARIASTCIGMVCRIPGADAVAAVIYTDAAYRAPDDATTGDGLARALLQRADSCGLRATDALCVAADAWGSYLDAECPAEGRPLSEITTADPGGIARPVGDQSTGAALPSVDPDQIAQVARAVDSLGDAIRTLCGVPPARTSSFGPAADASCAAADGASPTGARVHPDALDAACRLDDLPMLFELALGWSVDEIAPYDAAALAWCLARPALRDIALSQWCSDMDAGDEALEAQLRWEEGDGYPDQLAMHMWGEGARPDPQRLDTALDLVRRIAALAPRPLRAGPLAACAWLSWALGRSTHADLYARLAREIDPQHGLAEIVASFVAAGHLPDWAFERPAATARKAKPRSRGTAKRPSTRTRRDAL